MTEERLKELFLRHNKGLLLFAFGYLRELQEAEDVVQEAFIHAYSNAKDGEDIKTYLYNFVKWDCLDILKRRKIMEAAKYPEPEVDYSSIIKECREFIHRMAPGRRRLFILMYEYGYSLSEAAGEIGITQGTAMSHHHRGLESIRRHFNITRMKRSFAEKVEAIRKSFEGGMLNKDLQRRYCTDWRQVSKILRN